MSAPNQPENTPPPGTPGSSAPTGGTPSAPTEWRVPDTDPRAWARGKTATELLSLTDQAIGAYQAMHAQMTAPPPPPPPQPSFDPNQVRDEDYVDGRTLKQYLATAAAPFQQGFQSVHESLAQNNLAQVRAKHPDAFERYSGEIMDLVARIPASSRTLDNLELTVELVMGRHVRDEAKRLASEMAANYDPTLRSSGGAGTNMPGSGRPGPVTASDELPADYRDLLKQKGIDDRTLAEFFGSQGMGPEQQREWFEKAKKHNVNVITERSRRGG